VIIMVLARLSKTACWPLSRCRDDCQTSKSAGRQ
jgi:hypothetical protein